MQDNPKPRRVVRGRTAAAKIVGLSEVQYWRKEKAGLVPLPFKLVEGGRGIGYWEDELIAHQAARNASRDKSAA